MQLGKWRRVFAARTARPLAKPCASSFNTSTAAPLDCTSPSTSSLLPKPESRLATPLVVICAVTRPKPEEPPINYTVNNVGRSTDGWGFSIVDSRSSTPLVRIEFEHQEKAREAHRVIGQAIAIAVKITPQAA